jgi:branched-subunit amino acid aminotransferase/4-amino-4-deoxychorismate lyase
VFDFFGVINKKPFYGERHLDRFFTSLNLLRLKINFNRAEVERLIESVIQQNEEVFYLKLFAIPLNSEVAQNLSSAFYILPVDSSSFDSDVYKNGGNLITKEYMRFLPEAKSTNYLPLIYWYPEISEGNAIDVLFFHNNTIHETSRGNIFLVKNNAIKTPANNILKGITRSVVIDIMRKKNLHFAEESITLDELYGADEIFLTSTTKKILPIVKVDHHVIGNGKVGDTTKGLMQLFGKLQEEWR